MELLGIWRYPVKSMAGEALAEAELDGLGVAGDRRFGVVDLGAQRTISAKREGRLLEARAASTPGLRVTLPGGEVLDGPGPGTDAALSAWLGRDVGLRPADRHAPATFESQADEEDDASGTVTWDGQPGSLVDSAPVHVVTTATLDALRVERPDLTWEVERFRPNLVIHSPEEDLGPTFTVGPVHLETLRPCERCVMITRAQPRAGGTERIERQVEGLRHVQRARGGSVGVLARVVGAGRVQVGHQVTAGSARP